MKLAPPGPRPQGGLLGELLGRARVAGQVECQAGESGQLGGEGSAEDVVLVARPGLGKF